MRDPVLALLHFFNNASARQLPSSCSCRFLTTHQLTHTPILTSTGLESTVTSVFGAAPKGSSFLPSPLSPLSSPPPSLTLPSRADPNNADATYLASTAPTTPLEKIKNAIYLVYINSAV